MLWRPQEHAQRHHLRAATAPENDGDNNPDIALGESASQQPWPPPPSPLILPEDASPLHPDLDEPAPPPAEPRHVDMPHHMATHTPEIRPPPRRHIINRCNKRNTKIKARGPVPCASTHTCFHRDATLPTALDTAELHAAWQLQRHTRARRSTTLHKLISVGFQLICWEGMCVIPPSPPPRRNYVASVEAAYAAMARYNYYWVHDEQPLRISQTSSPAQLKGTRWEIGLGFFSTVELLEDVESIFARLSEPLCATHISTAVDMRGVASSVQDKRAGTRSFALFTCGNVDDVFMPRSFAEYSFLNVEFNFLETLHCIRDEFCAGLIYLATPTARGYWGQTHRDNASKRPRQLTPATSTPAAEDAPVEKVQAALRQGLETRSQEERGEALGSGSVASSSRAR
ncbi:hypothetical protein C8F04DRAFT_1264200 [Mycena alexandri]|uniref:Uncharacterized protein n=1 Tax=Mycena alexandri TaxID=1745969 RepID=A0AAD6X0A9_9AGAR|nr:hypothetical protein C8F04DRAFT_1264200 [Mycena alexandri]